MSPLVRAFESLRSIWAIVSAMLLGILVGLQSPRWTAILSEVGSLYITYLIMCVPPIMLTAITSTLPRLVAAESAGKQLRRILTVFTVLMLVWSTVVVLTMLVASPGHPLPSNSQVALGQLIRRAEQAQAAAGANWLDLFLSVVPANIVAAVVESNYPQILFVSILIGLLLGFSKRPEKVELLEMADAGFKMFQRAVAWGNYALPFAIVGIVAGQVARTGFEIVFAVIKLLAVGIGLSAVAVVTALLVVSRVLRRPVADVWSSLRGPMMMGFGTTNSMAAMPMLMDSLADNFALPRQMVNLVVPLSVLVARTANLMYTGMLLTFSAQLYQIELSPVAVVTLIVTSVFATVVGVGMPTIPYLTTLTIIAAPMGLPLEAIIPIFVSIMPVLDPFGTAACMMLHAVAASVVIGRAPQTATTRQRHGASPSTTTPAPAS